MGIKKLFLPRVIEANFWVKFFFALQQVKALVVLRIGASSVSIIYFLNRAPVVLRGKTREAFLSSHATCVRARQGARIEHRSHSFHIAGVSSSKDTTLSQESNVQVDKVNVKHATRPHNTQQIMQTVWEKVVIFMDFAVLERLPRKASNTGALPSLL